jgi:DNA-binding transcriptional LysR family regulator
VRLCADMLGDLWPGLDLRHLAAFAAVAETRSFARAAEALGYTQPAVSQQVAALEKIVGDRLFERSSGRAEATLTEAGVVLLRHVEALTARLAAARQDLADLALGEAGTLRVGAFQSALARLLPDVLLRYRELWPSVEIDSVERSDDLSLLADLRRGALDFAFALLPLDTDAFQYRRLVDDGFVLVSKLGERQIRKLESLDDLSGVPLILYRTCRSAAVLLHHLERHTRHANVVFRSDDNAGIKEMVRAGVGAAILPELWTQLGGNDGLELVPLDGLVPPRVVVLAWRKDRLLTPGQQAFVDVATAVHPQRRSKLAIA